MKTVCHKLKALNPASEAGLTLTELLVAISLFTLAMGAITGAVIMGMRTQETVNADFRSQLDVRQSLYDMESEVSEAKTIDSYGLAPVFQQDALTVPDQNGGWITYEYAIPYGQTSPTIIRYFTQTKPSQLPITPGPNDGEKQMIVINDSQRPTSVDRVSSGAPIFTYYDNNGKTIAAPVSTPTDVRSITVAVKVSVTDGHAQQQSTDASVQINLRNFNYCYACPT